MNIGLVIPAYEEEENISKLIQEIKRHIKAKIIIVDDSENNLTKKIFKKRKKDVFYFKRKNKLGRGSAVLFGLRKLLKLRKISIFIELDADHSHRPSEINRNLKYFKKNSLDLLISSRYLKESKIKNWPISRLFFSYISNKLARFLLGVGVTDYTNGFRIYSRRSAESIVKDCGRIGDGFIILSEILLNISKKKYKIGEINSIFINRIRGQSSVTLKLIIESFFGLIRLFFILKFIKN